MDYREHKHLIVKEILARIDDRAYKYADNYDDAINSLYKTDWCEEIEELLQQYCPGTKTPYSKILTDRQIDLLIYEKASEFPKT